MAMTLRSVVALALAAFAVTEDISQDAAPALEALPQSFWDNFVYCKCGLSCAEKDGSIGKADVDAAVGPLAKSAPPPPAPRAPAEGVFAQLADLSRLARNLPVYRKLQCIGRGSFGKAYLVEVVRAGKKKADTASYRVVSEAPERGQKGGGIFGGLKRPWRSQEAEWATPTYQFPSYTSMQPQYADKANTAAASESSQPGGRTQGVQTLLNPARKAEQRLLRLRSTKAKITAQFEAFLHGLKRSFIKEMNKHQADTARLEQSITEAEQEQDRAFAVIRQAILGGTMAASGVDGTTQAAEGVWDQMRAHWEQSDGDLLREVMRGASDLPKAAAPRQLTAEAQALLAHFGVPQAPHTTAPTTTPTTSTVSASPMTAVPTAPQLGVELQQLLQHFGASGPPAGTPVNEPVAPRGPLGEENHYGGLDPSLFEPTSGAIPAFGGAERPPSNSVRQALAQKLDMVRAVAAQKDAMEQATRTAHQTAGVPNDPHALGAPPGIGPVTGGPTAAMRPFGGHGVLRPPQEPPPPSPHGEDETRAIPIREAESEDDMEEALLVGVPGIRAGAPILDWSPASPLIRIVVTLQAEHLPGTCVDLPPHVHGPAPYTPEKWLGVTVYAPHVAPTVCAVRAERTDTIEYIIDRLRSTGRLPHPSFDMITVVHPQMHDGCLAFLAYPSIIAQYANPRTAVIIDLSRVGGHCHAAVIRSDITSHELLQQVRLQIRADYDEEDLQVWVGDATLPATRTGLLNVAHGTLLTVMRTPYAPGSLPLASSLFAPAARWCRVDHMPAPPRTYSLALCRGQALDPVCPAFFPWAQTTDIVRKVYRLPQDDDKIVVVDNDPILDVQGEPCAQTAVAFSGSGLLFDQGPVQAYFLDVRLLGEAPRLVYLSVMSDKRIDLPDILDAAQIDIPTHLAGVVLQNTMYGDLQVLQVGLGPDLAHSIFHTCPSDNPESGEVEASIPGFTRCQYDVRQSSGLPAHAHEEPQGQVPTRFGQVNDPPTAHEALNLVAEEEAEQWDLLPIHTCFLVFVPRFRPEYVRVTLTLPCELDDALHTVSIARNSATSVHFDNLIPVEPQPDRTFASLLAVPDWVTDEICCLIDLRALDGRLFALVVFGSMKRSWILLHLGLPQDPHLRVYVAEELLEPDRLYPVHLGVTITILPADRTLQPGGTLADMLSSEAHWLPQCPLYDGPDDSSFLLLSDGGCKVVHIDVENALTSRRLKNISAETFQYCVDAVTVCKATPGPSDLAIQGQYCRAALTATETISRIPIPPGRLLPPQFILYIDQRLILSDISWRLVPHGYIGLDKLTAEFAGRAPPGYVVQFKGCPTEQHGDRTFLRIEHGQVITATYVEDNTASITTPPDDGSESSSQSDPDSDSEANSDMHSDSILRSPSNTDNRQQDRSRSPRGPPPPTPVRHLSLSTYCNSESVTFLVGSLGITKCAGFGVISDSVSIGLVWAGLQEPEILGDIYRQPAQKRFLDEPGGHTPRDAQHMQQLRHITLQLGGTWLPNTRPLIPGELAPIDFEFEHHVGRVPEVVIWVSFAILKEGYQAEQVTVQLSVPATPEEAEAALQAARDPRMRRLFPQVVAVLPQPSYGTAVYLANPIWYPNMPGVCFDLIDLDGRIYTTTLPDYISRHELLALVNHPQPDTLRVLVGFDAQQLTNEEPVHLYPGELITLLAPGGEEPIPYTIGQLLLMRDAWSASYSLPTPNTEHAYCLVARGRARLHIADASAPARYRDDIAAAVGMNTRDMRLYAASPATQDVAEQGVPCRTVIAAYDTQRQYAHPWHGILLDCRPILEDWQELCVTDGRLNVRSVLRALQDSTPRGWCPDLSVTADDDGYAHVRAGQVVIVTYHPAPQSATSGDASHASHASMPSVDPSGQQELSSPGSEPPASPASSEHNDIEESPAQDAGTDNRLMSLSVFVYSQQYTPEHCRLHLPPQPAIQDVIDSIRSIRHVIAQRIFPDLIPVHPQPDSGWVTMIALPAWPFIGTPVFIQVLGPAARRFAIYVPNVLTRADVLFLAQCDERAPCHVHFRDTPWPLPEDGAFPIRAGDLITIRPINVDLPVMRPLAVILAQASQWDWPYHTPAYWNAGAWLVTDQRSFHASIAPPPNAEVHSEAADAMCIPQDDVNVGPAYPSIVDHADAGHTSTSVVAVARRHLDTHDVPPTAVPYILDLRPLLLPLILERATDGVLEIAWVCERVQHLCPAGFCVRIYGGTFDGSAANNYRQVVPGAVIRVELHPTPPIPADSEESDGRFHSYYHTPDLSGQEADDASTVQHSSSSPTRQMPDTGGQYIYVLSGLLAQYTRVITMLTPSRMQTPVVVAIAVATGHCRVGTAVPPGTPFHLGEADDLPQTSEQLAIAWALIWAVEHAAHYQCPLEFMYDCLTAGKGAFGDWRMPAQPNAGGHSVLSHHLLCLRQLAQVTLNISHGHVPGHTGCLENEYADQLAKQARRVPEDPYDRMLPRWPARFLQHSLRAWGWAAAVHHPDIPALFAFESEADRLQQLDRRPTKAPFPASSPAAPQTAPIADCVFHIVAVTYNTLTMRDTSASKSDPHVGMRVTGRKTILKDQLAPHQPLFIGLQETRLPEDGIQPGPDYLIYQSAATAAGHFGCSLWIARTVPYAVRDGKPLYLRSEHVNILGYSPRHITACVKAEALRLFVMVCHSPNAYSSPIMEYASFWQDRAQELARRAVGFDYLILADANARVGHLPTEHVGNHHEEVENPPGEIFHEFLASQQAFLPSTFQEVHHGPSHTWVSPGGDQHRIDYIVIPLAWKAFQMSSQVLYTVELLQAREDHYPVLFTCEFARHAPPDHYQPAQKRHDARPARPSTSADQAAVIRALHQVSCISWDTEVDAHYDQLAQSWREVGGQLTSAAPTSQSPAHPSLSEHTRRLVDYRRALRQYLRQEAAERRRRHLIYGFVALWLHARNRSFDLAQRHTLDRWFRELDISEAEALSRLHLFGFYLRKQVALDRRRYLQDLADNVKLQDLRNPRALYQAVRKAFPSARSARQSSFRPLPAVTDAQGKLVTTSEDRAERWRSFFGDQEAGFPATDQDYVVHMREGPRLQSTHVFDIGAVPTLPELENVLHRTMRSRLLDVLAHFRPPLQAGAMPGEGIEYISLAAQCFQQYREGKRQPWALVFYDIQAAFYSVVRELIVPAVQSDEGLLRLFHALKIPPQALTELANKLETIALLPSLRTSPHLVGMVQDLYRGTWFKLSQSALLTITQRGTRPGDPAADAVFGLAMAALLHSIDERLTGAGLLPDVPQVNRTPEWATLTSEPRWGCPAWADDFVQPVDGDSDAQLLGKVQQGVGLVSGCVSVMGMKLTFDAEKTAVLLPARLDLQQPPIQRHGESYYIPVSDPITTELHQLPVIRAYKHLGGILTADASPVMDLHHRHARAMSVVKPLRAKLFAQCEQPLALRRTLLRSLAVSKYVHTGAAILLKAAFHQRLWAQHYIQLWKALIARKAPDQHIHAYQVLFLARAPSPTLALAKARAVLLAKLVQAGPSFLGYLLVMHWQCVPRTAWLSQLEQDYKVVVAFLPQLADLVPPSAPVTAILDSLVEEPTWWLKQVRCANTSVSISPVRTASSARRAITCVYLIPPMDLEEIRAAERPSLEAKRKTRKGPHLPTRQERYPEAQREGAFREAQLTRKISRNCRIFRKKASMADQPSRNRGEDHELRTRDVVGIALVVTCAAKSVASEMRARSLLKTGFFGAELDFCE
ncbi:hypothetical protein AK812_SmicGene28712 [Symbiodinium microadriaticum]|uniref:Uncharacterized protein n=1 Tax=Symbiodinium microadriaticum TaxID=2951 RepID=A0A1Q9D3Q9_SYMMI|nr:hypothetical protein AK812_SmicGene28712 [Symbiodinium microadriaticum]